MNVDEKTEKGKVLLIIPAYNEAGNIRRVMEELFEDGRDYDYIIINDGSKDETGSICLERGYRCINMPINVGLSEVFHTGIKYAVRHGYDMAVQYDGDGQHDPKYLEKMIKKMKEVQADIVIGSRYIHSVGGRSLRNVGSCVLRGIIRLTTGIRISDPTSGLRIYNVRAMRFLAGEINMAPEPDTIAFLIRNGFKVTEVDVKMRERQAGKSYLNLSSSIKYMINMCMSLIFIQWFRRKENEPDI